MFTSKRQSERRIQDAGSRVRESVFAGFQTLLPTHALSWAWLRITRIRSRWFSQMAIGLLRRFYAIDLSDAAEPDPARYPDLNTFFTRALTPGARPMPADPRAIACPVDGTISQAGHLDSERIVQAKRRTYGITPLLGNDRRLARPFIGGCFCTLYLAPHNYHRVHMPSSARLEVTRHIPGRLFSVNPASARTLPGLFMRNERVVTLWWTRAGAMGLILVGAMLVGSIETVWSGVVTSHARRVSTRLQYPNSGAPAVRLARGAEMGRFNMGSSVIVLYGRDTARWADDLKPGLAVRVGRSLGTLDGF